MGFATDTGNNVYCATKLNNREELVIMQIKTMKIMDKLCHV